MLEFGEQVLLLNHAFIDDVFIILKVKGGEDYFFFIDEKTHNQVKTPSIDLYISLLLSKYNLKTLDANNEISQESNSEYVETKSLKKFNLLLGRHFEIHILFLDGKAGIIYSNKKQNEFFIIIKDYKCVYKDKDASIKALYYYLEKGGISELSLISKLYA